MEGTLEIPPYFLCPISLEMMRDPVTLLTGITYDRSSIERWIFSDRHQTCPVTNLPLADPDMITPNHTLRRLIQGWCVTHASDGIERFPTPKPPLSKSQINSILDEAKKPQSTVSSLRKLRGIIAESDRNRRCMEESTHAIDFLVSIVRDYKTDDREEELFLEDSLEMESTSSSSAIICEEALSILYNLQLSDQGLVRIIEKNGDFIDILTTILAQSNYHCRAYAILLLKSLVTVLSPAHMVSTSTELIQEVVRVLLDQISAKATKAAFQVIHRLSPWGKNRVRAVEAGAVQALIELLLDEQDKRVCELILLVLEQLCRSAEGRANLVSHSAGIVVVSKKIFRVSHVASEGAVRVLNLVAKYSASQAVLQEMVQLGVVNKLFLVLQTDCTVKAKEKAKEILGLHARVWKGSPCLATQLRASYPC